MFSNLWNHHKLKMTINQPLLITYIKKFDQISRSNSSPDDNPSFKIKNLLKFGNRYSHISLPLPTHFHNISPLMWGSRILIKILINFLQKKITLIYFLGNFHNFQSWIYPEPIPCWEIHYSLNKKLKKSSSNSGLTLRHQVCQYNAFNVNLSAMKLAETTRVERSSTHKLDQRCKSLE